MVRPKFVAKDRERDAETDVLIAEPLELPIPRGLAGPGMLADTIVKRWQDHMPLNRLEDMYTRDGLELARSTMCGWHAALADIVKPLIAAMREDAFAQPYLCVDATGVLVQQKERCRTGHFWVMVAPARHVLFEFTRDHSSDAVDDVLAGYQGYLVADAHVVYDHLYVTGDVIEVNCRVGGCVAAPAPHRPGRADFPHPVLPIAVSLTGRRTDGRFVAEAVGNGRAAA